MGAAEVFAAKGFQKYYPGNSRERNGTEMQGQSAFALAGKGCIALGGLFDITR